jgi:hypothetical protein
MHDRAASYPSLDGPALDSREGDVDFYPELHQFGSLRCGPFRTVGGFDHVEYAHLYARASQRCLQSGR